MSGFGIDPLPVGASSGAGSTTLAFLGFGLLTPFQRDQRGDFANGGTEALVRSSVGQILGMLCSSGEHTGELPWRPELGSLLDLLRHAPLDVVTSEIARVYVADALERWEPRVVLTNAAIYARTSPGSVTPDTRVLAITYDVIRANVAGNQVLLSNVSQEVEV
jgi:phage baseplate assembly protein W